MKFKDDYETLGVERNSTQDDINRACRKLARKYHPDVSKDADAEARFKKPGEAYATPKAPEKRAGSGPPRQGADRSDRRLSWRPLCSTCRAASSRPK